MFSSREKWRCLMPIMVVLYLPLGRDREEVILLRLPSLLQCLGERRDFFNKLVGFRNRAASRSVARRRISLLRRTLSISPLRQMTSLLPCSWLRFPVVLF